MHSLHAFLAKDDIALKARRLPSDATAVRVFCKCSKKLDFKTNRKNCLAIKWVGNNFCIYYYSSKESFLWPHVLPNRTNKGGPVEKIFIDITDLQSLIFERQQILALLENTELWRRIPLAQRFAIVDSSEFVTLMGSSFTEHARRMLENELEAMASTIH